MEHYDPSKIAHFETLDYAGRKIFCSLIEWEHICEEPHSYMEGEEEEVIAALKNPDHGIRYCDADYEDTRRVYYMTHLPKECFVKVIVEFQDAECMGDGKIVTAYEPENIKPGEKLEFPK